MYIDSFHLFYKLSTDNTTVVTLSENFVYLDDVNYIKQGWVHRNRILVNKQPLWVSLSLSNASQNRKINEIEIFFEDKIQEKILKTILMNYKKAPFFEETYGLIQRLIGYEDKNLANFLIYSTTEIAKSLKMNTVFARSSELMDTSSLRAQDKQNPFHQRRVLEATDTHLRKAP